MLPKQDYPPLKPNYNGFAQRKRSLPAPSSRNTINETNRFTSKRGTYASPLGQEQQYSIKKMPSRPVAADAKGKAPKANMISPRKFEEEYRYKRRRASSLLTVQAADGTTEEVVNWSETPLYEYYHKHQELLNLNKFQQIGMDPQTGFIAWDQQQHYTNWQVEQLLIDIKNNFAKFQKKPHEVFYKAIRTLKHLYEEQAVDFLKYVKMRSLYAEICIQNALKLLIRCKIVYSSRIAILDIFDSISRFTASETLLIDYIGQETSVTDHDDAESRRQQNDEHIEQLVSQFTDVAGELASKVHLVQKQSHLKSLAGKPFYFGADKVCFETVQQRVQQVKHVIENHHQLQAVKMFSVPVERMWRMKPIHKLNQELLQRRKDQIESFSKHDEQFNLNKLTANLDAEILEMQKQVQSSELAGDEDVVQTSDSIDPTEQLQQVKSAESSGLERNIAECLEEVSEINGLKPLDGQKVRFLDHISSMKDVGNDADGVALPSKNGLLRLNVSNLSEVQIKKLWELKIISTEQARDAVVKSREKKLLKRNEMNEKMAFSKPLEKRSRSRKKRRQLSQQIVEGPAGQERRFKFENQTLINYQFGAKKNNTRNTSLLYAPIGDPVRHTLELPAFDTGPSQERTLSTMHSNRAKLQTQGGKRSRGTTGSNLRNLHTRGTLGGAGSHANKVGSMLSFTQRHQSDALDTNDYGSGSVRKVWQRLEQQELQVPFPTVGLGAMMTRPETQGHERRPRHPGAQQKIIQPHLEPLGRPRLMTRQTGKRPRQKHSEQPASLGGTFEVPSPADPDTANDSVAKDLTPPLSEQTCDVIRVQDSSLPDQPNINHQQRPLLQDMLQQDNKVAGDADLASYQDINAQTIGQRLDQKMRRKEPLPAAGNSLRHRLNNRRATQEPRTVVPGPSQDASLKKARQPVDELFNAKQKSGAATPRMTGAGVTRPLVRIDEEGLNNKVGASTVSPLQDGRRHGYHNQTLIPPLERHSNSRVHDLFNTRSASVDQPAPRLALPSKTARSNNDPLCLNSSVMQTRRQCERTPPVRATVPPLVPPIARKPRTIEAVKAHIVQIDKRLRKLGVNVPQKLLAQVAKLQQEKPAPNSRNLRLKLANDHTFPRYEQHTRNSQVRQELHLADVSARKEEKAARRSKMQNSMSPDEGDTPLQTDKSLQAQMNNEGKHYSPIHTARVTDTNRTRLNDTGNYGQPSAWQPQRSTIVPSRAPQHIEHTARHHIQTRRGIVGQSFSALDSLFQNNQRSVAFSSQYSNVWAGNQNSFHMMYEETNIASLDANHERESKVLLFHMDRELKRLEIIKEKETKAQLLKYYYENYEIVMPEKQTCVMPLETLRRKLIKKATEVKQHKAAVRIQRWYRRILFFKWERRERQKVKAAIRVISTRYRLWTLTVRDPRRIRDVTHNAARLIQKFMHGYKARRDCLVMRCKQKTDLMYDYFSRIDKITRGHFQRRVRRAWLAYKQRKEEKRKAKEAADAAKKNKRGRFGRSVAKASNVATAVRGFSQTSPQKPPSTTNASGPATPKDSARKDAGATNGLDLSRMSMSEAVPNAGDDVSSLNDRDPFSQTMQPSGVPEEMVIDEERDGEDVEEREEGDEGAEESPDPTNMSPDKTDQMGTEGSPEKAKESDDEQAALFEVKTVPAPEGTDDKSSKEADETTMAAGAAAEKAPSLKSESLDSKHKIVPENMDTVKNLLETKPSQEEKLSFAEVIADAMAQKRYGTKQKHSMNIVDDSPNKSSVGTNASLAKKLKDEAGIDPAQLAAGKFGLLEPLSGAGSSGQLRELVMNAANSNQESQQQVVRYSLDTQMCQGPHFISQMATEQLRIEESTRIEADIEQQNVFQKQIVLLSPPQSMNEFHMVTAKSQTNVAQTEHPTPINAVIKNVGQQSQTFSMVEHLPVAASHKHRVTFSSKSKSSKDDVTASAFEERQAMAGQRIKIRLSQSSVEAKDKSFKESSQLPDSPELSVTDQKDSSN